MPRLFQWGAPNPKESRTHAKQQIHGHDGEPDEISCLAMNPIRYHQQRDGKRCFAPRLGANGQSDGDLADEIHIVEVLKGNLPNVFTVT
jgi:hypothetical protein